MGIKTNIEWCDSSANLQMGCDGCELWTNKTKTCYSGVMTEKFAGNAGWPERFDLPKVFPHRLDTILGWHSLLGKDREDKTWLNGMPRMIFLNDMGDTFTESLATDWLLPFIPKLENSKHIYMILTKRVKRMAQFFDLLGYVPSNFWIGTSITTQASANSRIPHLLQIPAKVRFLSVEPLLEAVDFTKIIPVSKYVSGGGGSGLPLTTGYETDAIDWVIVGGESGPNKRPFNPDWARSIRDQCQAAHIPFFMKQIDKVQPIPGDLMIREFPNV